MYIEKMMTIIYNSRYNIFRTLEMSDSFFLIYSNFTKKSDFYNWLDIILLELQNGAKFIFDLSHESPIPHEIFNVYRDDTSLNFLDWIVEYIDKNNLEKDSIQVWTGALNIRELSPDMYKNIIFGKVRFNHYPHRSTDYTFLNLRKFDKKFSLMFGRLLNKKYRIDIYDELNKINVLKNSYYSFNTIDTLDTYPKIYMEPISEIENINYDFPRSGEAYFKKSIIHLVIETFFYSIHSRGKQVFTEKIFRAINSCQPFILFNTAGSLNKLKEIGFKTFDKWWDESYDLEEDDTNRLKMLYSLVDDLNKKSIEDLTNMYNEMIPILQHNFDISLNLGKVSKYGSNIAGIFEHITGEENIVYKMSI